jgi:hypothetical protein
MPRRAFCQMPRPESCSASQASPSAAAPAFSRCTTPARPPKSTPSAFASTTRASSAGQVPSLRSRGTIPARRRGLVERRDEDDTNRTISTTTTTLTRTTQRIPSHEDSHSHTTSPSASSAVPPPTLRDRVELYRCRCSHNRLDRSAPPANSYLPDRRRVRAQSTRARQRRVLLLLPDCPQGSPAARLPACLRLQRSRAYDVSGSLLRASRGCRPAGRG